MEEEVIRELLSSKNLKSLRSGDSSRRSSGCFGRRMDRIGSMSSLGCNTVGRYSKYQEALHLHGLNPDVCSDNSCCPVLLQIQSEDQVLQSEPGPAPFYQNLFLLNTIYWLIFIGHCVFKVSLLRIDVLLFNAEYVNKCLQMLIDEKVVLVLKLQQSTMLCELERGGKRGRMLGKPTEAADRVFMLQRFPLRCSLRCFYNHHHCSLFSCQHHISRANGNTVCLLNADWTFQRKGTRPVHHVTIRGLESVSIHLNKNQQSSSLVQKQSIV